MAEDTHINQVTQSDGGTDRRERRVRKGDIKVRQRTQSNNQDSAEQSSIDKLEAAKQARLARRAARKLKREVDQTQNSLRAGSNQPATNDSAASNKPSTQAEVPASSSSSTSSGAAEETTSPTADTSSSEVNFTVDMKSLSRKMEREKRKQARAERRKQRTESREKARAETAKLSTKEKLQDILGDTKSSSKSSNSTLETSSSSTAPAEPFEDLDDKKQSISENKKLGSETVGAGQTGQAPSAIDRISKKLQKASKEATQQLSSEKAAARLSRVLKKVAPKKDTAEAKTQDGKAEANKKLDTKNVFLAALTKHLQNHGDKIDQFKTLEMTATSQKYMQDVIKLQKRSETCTIRVVKDSSADQSAIKTAAQNVGHIFNKTLDKKISTLDAENILSFFNGSVEEMEQVFETLSKEQKQSLAFTIMSHLNEIDTDEDYTEHEAADLNCPYCGHHKVQQAGTVRGQALYKCCSCKKTFSFNNHQNDIPEEKDLNWWKEYANLIMQNKSIRYITDFDLAEHTTDTDMLKKNLNMIIEKQISHDMLKDSIS